MDFMKGLTNDPGALFVGGMWALVSIFWHIRGTLKAGAQQDKVADSTKVLVDGLHALAGRLQAQVDAAENRAARLSTENTEMYIKVGRLTSESETLQEQLTASLAREAEARLHIERLVIDVHNQRHSIDSLSLLNRQMLETLMDKEAAQSSERKDGNEIVDTVARTAGPRCLGDDRARSAALCGPLASEG